MELRCRRHWASISLTRADIHPLGTGWVTNSKSVVGPRGPFFGNFPPPGIPVEPIEAGQALEGLAGHLGAGEAYSWGIRRTHEWHDARRSTKQPQGRSLMCISMSNCLPSTVFSDGVWKCACRKLYVTPPKVSDPQLPDVRWTSVGQLYLGAPFACVTFIDTLDDVTIDDAANAVDAPDPVDCAVIGMSMGLCSRPVAHTDHSGASCPHLLGPFGATGLHEYFDVSALSCISLIVRSYIGCTGRALPGAPPMCA